MPGQPKNRKALAKLQEIDPAEVIERHAKGQSVTAMIKHYGVTTKAWYDWVKSHDGLMETLRLVREAKANDLPWEALELADHATKEDIAVIRERIRTRLWIAERTGTEFKPKQELSVEVNVIDQHLQALKAAQDGTVLEAEIVEEEEAATTGAQR